MFELDKVEKEAHNPENRATDEWYDNYIQQYKDSEFYNELQNNPYLIRNNREYDPGFLGGVLEGFGFSSGRSNYYEDLLMARNEKLSQIEAQIREQKRNEPAAEVQRKRAAGLNVDLTGGQGIGSGEAAQNDQPIESPGGMNAGAPVQEFTQGVNALWGAFQQAYSMTMGIMSDAQTLKQARNATEAGDIRNLRDMLETANEAVKFGMHGNGYGGDNDAGTPLDYSPKGWLGGLLKSNRTRKRFEKAYTMARMNVENTRKNYEEGKGLKEDIIGYETTRGEFDVAMTNDFARDFAKGIYELSQKLRKLQMQNALRHEQNIAKYEDTKDYGAQAEAENVTAANAIEKMEAEKAVNSFLSEWNEKLERDSKSGNWIERVFANLMLGLMGLTSLNMMPSIGLPSINVTNRAGNVYTTNNNNAQ